MPSSCGRVGRARARGGRRPVRAVPARARLRRRRRGVARGLRGRRPHGRHRPRGPVLDHGRHPGRRAARACAPPSRPARASPAGTAGSSTRSGIATDYLQLVGAQFAAHPGGPLCRAHDRDHRRPPDRRGHATTSRCAPSSTGCSPTRSTTCWRRRPSRPAPTTRWHAPVTSPAVWTRRWGAGRVFVCAPGHLLADLEVPGRAHDHRARPALGEPLSDRWVRSGPPLPSGPGRFVLPTQGSSGQPG